MDRHTEGLRERESLSFAFVIVWITFMGYFFWIPFGHFDLPGSQPIFGLSQGPPLCAHTSLCQDGFCCKGLWAKHPLTALIFDLQGTFSCMCGLGSLQTSRTRNAWSGQGPASSLNCPTIPILEFQSTWNEWISNLFTLGTRVGVDGGGRHLPPAYVHCLVNRVVVTLKYPTAASCWFPV